MSTILSNKKTILTFLTYSDLVAKVIHNLLDLSLDYDQPFS